MTKENLFSQSLNNYSNPRVLESKSTAHVPGDHVSVVPLLGRKKG